MDEREVWQLGDEELLAALVDGETALRQAYACQLEHGIENAAAQLRLRRQAIRAKLLDLGAGEDTAGAVDAATETHEPAVGLAVLPEPAK